MKILADLFWAFFKIGLFTFGGGAAMLPLLQIEFVEKRKWISDDDLVDYYSIGQCTPGIIALNTATFIGYKKYGLLGAVMATLGVVTPSVIIILSVASMLVNYMANPYVVHAFSGVRLVVVALIVDVVCKLWKKTGNTRWGKIIFVSSLALLVGADFSPAMLVVCSGISGFVYKFFIQRAKK